MLKKILFVFYILFACSALAQGQGKWIQGIIRFHTGDTLMAEIKKQNFYNDRVVVRREGQKLSYSIEEVTSFQYGEKEWKRIYLAPDLDVAIFASKCRSDLYSGWIREVKCACDDSYRYRKVWVWKAGNELFIVRKRLLGKKLKNWNECRERIIKTLRLLDEQVPREMKFNEFPEFVSSLKIND